MKNNWQTKKLCELNHISFLRGNGLNKSLIDREGNFKCILYGELYTKYKHPAVKKVISKTSFNGKVKSEVGDVLVPGTTTADAYGIAIARSLNEEGVVLGGDINILRTGNRDILADYLSYFLNGPAKRELASYSTGTNILHLSNKKIQNIEISFPPLPEQNRIVKILDEVFADVAKAKENAEKNLQNAKELFESYLQGVFANPSSVKTTAGKLGKDWEERKLKEIGITQTGTTPKTVDKENYGDYIPFIKPADVDYSGIGDIRYDNTGLSEVGLKKGRKIEKGSTLMVCIGATIGKVGFAERLVSCNQQINSLTVKGDFEPKFIYYAMTSKEFQNKVLSEGKGAQATLPIINKSKWESLTIRFPLSKKEQKSIVAKLDALSAETKKLEAIYRQKLTGLEELKKSVLKKAFNGEL